MTLTNTPAPPPFQAGAKRTVHCRSADASQDCAVWLCGRAARCL